MLKINNLQKSVPSHNYIGTMGQISNKVGQIPFSLVERYSSYDSNFVYFLFMEFGIETARRVVDDYALGAIDHKTILWNITPDGRVYGGKVIGFDTNGRIKNPWLESMMATHSYEDISLMGWYVRETGFNNDVTSISDFLSPDLGTGDLTYRFVETPSLFGLHLIKTYPDRPIALTETHRAALIGAAIQPELNWMATGCSVRDMDVNILRPLKGKSMVVFPSNHSYYDWRKLAKNVDWCNIIVSDLTNDVSGDWICDIGDLLLSDYRGNSCDITSSETTTEQVITVEISPSQRALNDMIERNPSIGLLVSKLSLEVA
jgi:hypothetical protein